MGVSTRWLLVVPFMVCLEVLATTSAFSNLRHHATPVRIQHQRPSIIAQRSATSHLNAVLIPRGGASQAHSVVNAASSIVKNWKKTPSNLFHASFVALALLTVTAKLVQRATNKSNTPSSSDAVTSAKPQQVKSLQRRFLAVFWLLRCSDWLQGPYFYDVYASKIFGGAKASLALVSQLFLTGFASTALFGPAVGRAADQYGRKKATLAFSLVYALGALSTKSPLLKVLLVGRVLSGIGTCLLFSAPESWLVSESQTVDPSSKYLGETFGLAYAGDSIVAIVAGQLAAMAAQARGSTGPFELSTLFLALGGVLTALLWGENTGTDSSSGEGKTTIREAVTVIANDPKIVLVGATQSLFEAAMYIFVLQWPPAIAQGIRNFFQGSVSTPYGTIFSCFMACCLLGSTAFGQCSSQWKIPTEQFTCGMLGLATTAMAVAAWTVQKSQTATSLPLLMLSFFLFEACVGMYFPSIGTLRSRFVPDSHRSVIMNLFG